MYLRDSPTCLRIFNAENLIKRGAVCRKKGKNLRLKFKEKVKNCLHYGWEIQTVHERPILNQNFSTQFSFSFIPIALIVKLSPRLLIITPTVPTFPKVGSLRILTVALCYLDIPDITNIRHLTEIH